MLFDLHILFVIFILDQVSCIGINNITNNGCSEPSCLKCGPKGCIKCPNLIVYPTRKCVDTCPYGHRTRWSTLVDFMGKICAHNGNFMGLSNEGLAVFTGILTGMVLCTVMITSAVFYLKHKRKAFQQNMDANSELDDSPERRDFLKQLETLRPFAQGYLDMLNDTRRQMRELRTTGDNTALAAYRPIVRDLAKVLLLLNRPIERIRVPDDWEHLFNWAEKALKRYKRMSDISQPQVSQLINFFQSPVIPGEVASECSPRGSATMSTFKPDQVFGSSLSLQNVAIKNFNSNYDSNFHVPLNPQWKFEYSLINSSMPSSEFNPEVWKNSKEFINSPFFLEDDFHKLGFRPQDEITTEL